MHSDDYHVEVQIAFSVDKQEAPFLALFHYHGPAVPRLALDGDLKNCHSALYSACMLPSMLPI
jgi:hypothetical protein